jgi:hypothetical protein
MDRRKFLNAFGLVAAAGAGSALIGRQAVAADGLPSDRKDMGADPGSEDASLDAVLAKVEAAGHIDVRLSDDEVAILHAAIRGGRLSIEFD